MTLTSSLHRMAQRRSLLEGSLGQSSPGHLVRLETPAGLVSSQLHIETAMYLKTVTSPVFFSSCFNSPFLFSKVSGVTVSAPQSVGVQGPVGRGVPVSVPAAAVAEVWAETLWPCCCFIRVQISGALRSFKGFSQRFIQLLHPGPSGKSAAAPL